MSTKAIVLSCIVCGFVLSATAAGQEYGVLVDAADIHQPATPWELPMLGAHCIDGNTAYCLMRGKIYTYPSDPDLDMWGSEITKVTAFDLAPANTLLVSNDEYKAAVNGDNFDTIGAGNRMAVVGDYLQYLDEFESSIFRVHIETGELSVFVSSNGMNDVTTAGVGNLIDANAFDTNGAMAFYDETSDHVLLAEVNSNGDVSSNGKVSILIHDAEFDDYYGANLITNVSGGMTFDKEGNLYWSLGYHSSVPPRKVGVYKRAKDGTLSQLISDLDIWLVTGVYNNVAFNDIYAAPDGNIYFYDRSSDGILYFDPDDPVDTLAEYLTEDQLMAGPAGNDYVGSFNSHRYFLTWSHFVNPANDIYFKLLARLADYDEDGDIDVDDHAVFADCMAGPGATPSPTLPDVTVDGCLSTFDFDFDEDVDAADFAGFQDVFTGPGA